MSGMPTPGCTLNLPAGQAEKIATRIIAYLGSLFKKVIIASLNKAGCSIGIR